MRFKEAVQNNLLTFSFNNKEKRRVLQTRNTNDSNVLSKVSIFLYRVLGRMIGR